MRPVFAASLVVLVATAACAATPVDPSPSVYSGEASGGLGETIRIGDVRIRPIEVVEDSRCPEEVDCVHAGFFRVRVDIRTDGEHRIEVMDLRQGIGLEDARRLALDRVTPGRSNQGPRDPRPYYLTFTLGPGD